MAAVLTEAWRLLISVLAFLALLAAIGFASTIAALLGLLLGVALS